ncbi:hypothetical protein AB835_11520 [Candidatus Endobugula sertula]|uniref:DUF3429 domain-containing protein n=1 Tax=Candidatus Endobugula sertula TaxID=62101 RepID=A0A1D2QMY0_9GAMM|nr:hypothetical protein AB835_11520 [Candidatus Endobugula sertula]
MKPKPLNNHQDTITNTMYVGLLPFFAGALGPWIFPETELWLSQAFLLYSTLIFSFLAGAIWAIALFIQHELPKRHIYASIIFSLIPLLGYFLPIIFRTTLLLLGFLALLFWEKLFLKNTYPNWYQQLRHRISFIAVACHMLVIWNLMQEV